MAGWIETRDFKNELNDTENNLVDLLLYGFSQKEASAILYMGKKAFKRRIDQIKSRFELVTDLELVACRASYQRSRLLSVRAMRDDA